VSARAPLVDPGGGNDVVQNGNESARSEIALGLRGARARDAVLSIDLVAPVVGRGVASLDHLAEEVDRNVGGAIEPRGEELGDGSLARSRRARQDDDHRGLSL